MKKWDIRDEYELHNLIKKKVDLQKHKITLGRMPTIEFGNACQDTQVKDLMIELAPITRSNLAHEYERRYGTHHMTTKANYFHCIQEYIQGNTYFTKKPISH